MFCVILCITVNVNIAVYSIYAEIWLRFSGELIDYVLNITLLIIKFYIGIDSNTQDIT